MSYFFFFFQNSAREISKILGKNVGSTDFKTQRQWWAETPEHIQFCVYDYCTTQRIKFNEKYDYHIGTLTKNDTDKVIQYLKGFNLNAKYDNSKFK